MIGGPTIRGRAAAALALATAGLTAFSCSSAPTTSVATVSATAISSASSAPPHAVDTDRVSVTSIELPPNFKLDGDTTEFEYLAPLSASFDPEGPDPPRSQAPNSPDWPNHLAVAYTAEGATVVGTLSSAAFHGVWLGLGHRPALLPDRGEYGRAAGSWWSLGCPEHEMDFTNGEYVESSRPTPPEVLAACKRLQATRDKLAAEKTARFSRVFRFDAQGVRELVDARLQPVAGAAIHWGKSADGEASFEASLPLGALPRVADAPLMALRLAARATPEAEPLGVPPEQWTSVFALGVTSFEPHRELREALFSELTFGGMPIQPPPGLSFAPANPDLIEGFSADSEAITPVEAPLYTEIGKVGDVTVGRVSVLRDFLAIYKSGKFVGLVEPIRSYGRIDFVDVVTRDDALHVLSYVDRRYGGGRAFEPPLWSVTAVHADGTYAEVLPEDQEPNSEYLTFFEQPNRLDNKAHDEFGFTGKVHSNEHEYDATVRFKWDPKKKVYTGGTWTLTRPRKSR
ncbi:MAG: hypothetical protein U0271_17210 [Polyangiaceae bacterium]